MLSWMRNLGSQQTFRKGAAATFALLGIAIFREYWMSKHDSSDHAQFYIGVDGGGTSCRARIEDAEGRLLGQGSAGPATTRIGADRAMQAVRAASMAAAINGGLPPAALADTRSALGLAGNHCKGGPEARSDLPHPF